MIDIVALNFMIKWGGPHQKIEYKVSSMFVLHHFFKPQTFVCKDYTRKMIMIRKFQANAVYNAILVYYVCVARNGK